MTKQFEAAVNVDVNIKDADKIKQSREELNNLDTAAKQTKTGMDSATKSVNIFATATGGLKQSLNGVGSSFQKTAGDIQNSNTTVKEATIEFEDLGDAVAKTQRNVEALALQYGINDQRTQDAIKVAGTYKGQLEQLDFAIDSNKGGADQLLRGVQGLTAGFEIAAGTMALLGNESENLQKLLLKVQGAMALAQGLKDLKEYGGAIKALTESVGNKLVGAFSSLRSALLTSGIGAAIVGVGLLINEFVKLKQATEGASDEQKAYNKQLADFAKERELIQKGEERVTREALEKTNADLAKGQNDLKEIVDRRNKLITDSQRLGVNPSATTKILDAQVSALALSNEALYTEQVKLQAKLKSFDDQKAEAEKVKSELRTNEEVNNVKKTSDAVQKAEDEAFNTWLAQEIVNEEYRTQQADDEFNTWLAQEIANYDYRQQLLKENADVEVKIEADKQAKLLGYAKEEEDRMKAVAALEQQIYNDSVTIANNIIDLVGRQTNLGKGIALAQVAYDTAMALSGALATTNAPTPDNLLTGGLAGIAKYIALAATITTNAKRAKDIITGGNLNAGGGASPMPSINTSQLQPRSFQASAIPEEGFNRDYKVYVLEGEITKTQKRVKDIESVSVVE